MSLIDAKNLEKILPGEKIYDDALSPATKQLGMLFENTVKTLRFFTAPIDIAAAYQDRFQLWIKKISENIKPENITEGERQIKVPAIEGLYLAIDNSLLSEFFLNLLSNTFDKTKQMLAHPAFSSIISQLSHDEAVILFHLKKKSFPFKQRLKFLIGGVFDLNAETVEDDYPTSTLIFPENIDIYTEHLVSLNLVSINQRPNAYNHMFDNPIPGGFVYRLVERQLTSFGLLFTKACVPDLFENQ